MSQDRHVPNPRMPPFQQVADVLRMEILEGHLQVGQQLPTQHELVERFKVARATIQRALGALQDDGYIDSQQGRGAFVADWRHTAGREVNGTSFRPDKAMIALPPAIEAAFEADEVTLDTFSFTAETLYNALIGPLARVRNGELHPQRIKARLLLPSIDAHLAIPRNVSDPDDERPLHRLRRLMSSHAYNVVNALRDLQVGGYVRDVEAEIREVPITPMFKLYLLNGKEALFGYYRIIPDREVLIEGEHVAIHDVVGLGSVLFRQVKTEPNQPGTQSVEQSEQWFESLWSTIAKESTLAE